MSDDLDLEALAERAKASVKARSEAASKARAELALDIEADASPRTRGWFADVGASAARGSLKAVAATHEALGKLVDTPARWLGEHVGDLAVGEDGGLEWWTPSEVRAFNGKEKFKTMVSGQVPVAPVDQLLNKGVEAIGAPETTTGALTQGVSQFLVGLFPVSRAS